MLFSIKVLKFMNYQQLNTIKKNKLSKIILTKIEKTRLKK